MHTEESKGSYTLPSMDVLNHPRKNDKIMALVDFEIRVGLGVLDNESKNSVTIYANGSTEFQK